MVLDGVARPLVPRAYGSLVGWGAALGFTTYWAVVFAEELSTEDVAREVKSVRSYDVREKLRVCRIYNRGRAWTRQ